MRKLIVLTLTSVMILSLSAIVAAQESGKEENEAGVMYIRHYWK